MEFLELIKRLKFWLDAWLLIVIFALASSAIFVIAVWKYDPQKHDIAQLMILGITLVVLMVYA